MYPNPNEYLVIPRESKSADTYFQRSERRPKEVVIACQLHPILAVTQGSYFELELVASTSGGSAQSSWRFG